MPAPTTPVASLLPQPRRWVSDLREGETVKLPLGVYAAEVRTGGRAGRYGLLTVGDKTGTLPLYAWTETAEQADAIVQQYPAGSVVVATVRVGSFKGRPKLEVDATQAVLLLKPGDYDAQDFTPAAPTPLPTIRDGITALVNAIQDGPLRSFAAAVLAHPKVQAEFWIKPAAVRHHHSYRHGLAEHTLEVMKCGDAMAACLPAVNKDLVVVGCMLHDLGKIWEYDLDGFAPSYTEDGSLVGHMGRGVLLISELAPKVGLPPDVTAKLMNIVLSHHGRVDLGFGSAKDPASPEAVIVSCADGASTWSWQVRHGASAGGF